MAEFESSHARAGQCLAEPGASHEPSFAASFDAAHARSASIRGQANDIRAALAADRKATAAEEKPCHKIGLVAHDGKQPLRLRSSPDTAAANVVAELAFNTRVQVVAEVRGGWYRIAGPGGVTGYVAAIYVRTNLPEPTAKLHRVEAGADSIDIDPMLSRSERLRDARGANAVKSMARRIPTATAWDRLDARRPFPIDRKRADGYPRRRLSCPADARGAAEQWSTETHLFSKVESQTSRVVIAHAKDCVSRIRMPLTDSGRSASQPPATVDRRNLRPSVKAPETVALSPRCRWTGESVPAGSLWHYERPT
ncbi:MAG: SH3 domain-containing protein [Myxococcales bacterium]|nr:SH3 domain-containing protein [Myxococcales bacterium]